MASMLIINTLSLSGALGAGALVGPALVTGMTAALVAASAGGDVAFKTLAGAGSTGSAELPLHPPSATQQAM